MRLVPVIAAVDPLPDELIVAADTARSLAAGLLVKTSNAAVALRRVTAFGPRCLDPYRAAAEEAREIARLNDFIADRIAALQAREAELAR